MIITRKWLSEWIDITDISTSRLCEIFNSIGLEVASVKSIKMPLHVKVGLVKEKASHPDADKLSVCKVDVGDETLQIVCGAKNVEKDMFVPVATIGTKFEDGLTIKPTKLRGVDSNGMICSAKELGLPNLNEGILPLDESVGQLTLGREVGELFDDEIIELELTANRGDCLSIRGVARDLSAYLKKELKTIKNAKYDEDILGIGRILSLKIENKIKSRLIYKALQINSLKQNLLYNLRMQLVEVECENALECIIKYATYSTGVIFRLYNIEDFMLENSTNIIVKQNKLGFDEIVGSKPMSLVGFNQAKKLTLTKDQNVVILEASYIKPEIISKLAFENKNLKSDDIYYRSSRGSENNLEFGINYIENMLSNCDDVVVYSGVQKIETNQADKIISVNIDTIKSIIGINIDKNDIINILQSLEFECLFRSEQEVININIPPFRHDINDIQDICEEIVRMIGINNIASKPYKFAEKARINKAYKSYKKRYDIRQKSVAIGFFESIHYVFDDDKKLNQLGFRSILQTKKITNPITNELNTLRPTLALHLIEAVSLNVKNSRLSVALFEIGKIFSYERQENTKMAWIFSGYEEEQSVFNHSKPNKISLASFVKKIHNILGSFELKLNEPKNTLFSPYEFASIWKDGVEIGFVGRLHIKVEDEYRLSETYYCEVDFDKYKIEKIEAKEYSKYQNSSRELSLLVPKNMPFFKIKEALESFMCEDLIKFYPIDLFESEDLGENMSLSVKFIFQNMHSTLQDEQINAYMQEIQRILSDKLAITLR